MDTKIIKSISTQVYRRFPEMAGCQPKVILQAAPQPKSILAAPRYLLTYRNSVLTPGGKSIPRFVRVIVNGQGIIIKITTSR